MGMKVDITIGNGSMLASATLLRQGDGSLYVSHNRVSYWVMHAYLDTEIVIFKDTPEGLELTRLISTKCSNDELHAFFVKLVFTRLSVEQLQIKIAKAIEDAFEKGRMHQAAEIRSSLFYSAASSV